MPAGFRDPTRNHHATYRRCELAADSRTNFSASENNQHSQPDAEAEQRELLVENGFDEAIQMSSRHVCLFLFLAWMLVLGYEELAWRPMRPRVLGAKVLWELLRQAESFKREPGGYTRGSQAFVMMA